MTEKETRILSMLFVAVRFYEDNIRWSHHLLNCETKARLQGTLLSLKWLNKDFEKWLPDHLKEYLDEDVERAFKIFEKLIIATEKGKSDEFMEHIKKFEL